MVLMMVLFSRGHAGDVPGNLDVFLLLGQSNMAGRGALEAGDDAACTDVLILDRDGKWVCRGEPIHFDKPEIDGVGLGFTFAKLESARSGGRRIGLVPCAVGGTEIRLWMPGAPLYVEALRRARIALQAGTLRGILWHQGESDSDRESCAGTYAEHLRQVIEGLRRDLATPDVPFIAGELGYFNYAKTPLAETINGQLHALAAQVPNVAIVSSDGLKDKGDQLHFDRASQKELGRRYFDAFAAYEGCGAAAP